MTDLCFSPNEPLLDGSVSMCLIVVDRKWYCGIPPSLTLPISLSTLRVPLRKDLGFYWFKYSSAASVVVDILLFCSDCFEYEFQSRASHLCRISIIDSCVEIDHQKTGAGGCLCCPLSW
ncbi:hypothetical protein L2E82_11308 [Cichorium intybus]|uniref:Uncharacterized protein n=1 Tax=Cichorium intybus TaxID=13427 RepID=A0ACB9GCG1_CICIN|nr:hypothetical protein L2E82_11308 [Cichorium intybus]